MLSRIGFGERLSYRLRQSTVALLFFVSGLTTLLVLVALGPFSVPVVLAGLVLVSMAVLRPSTTADRDGVRIRGT